MDAKIDEVIGQYELHLNGKRRIRGGLLLETKEGNYTLTGYRENTARVEFDEAVKKMLIKKGYPYVDEGIRNKNGEWLTKDHIGNFWHMKKWHMGSECNLKEEEVYRAAGHLARLHRLLSVSAEEVESFFYLPVEKQPAGENSSAEFPTAAEEKGQKKNQFPVEEKNPAELFLRRGREMRRVYNYIRHKKKRNEMEIGILNLFPEFYEQAGLAKEGMENLDCCRIAEASVKEGKILHGSYNYHNVLFQDENIITTNFEKCAYGIQIMDLYGFLRKFLEKNNWNTEKGLRMLEIYQKNREFAKEEGKLLYLLFLFPEKFWKQMNFYYNGKKSWMSVKNLDKIKKLAEQEVERKKFLEEVKRVLFS